VCVSCAGREVHWVLMTSDTDRNCRSALGPLRGRQLVDVPLSREGFYDPVYNEKTVKERSPNAAAGPH